MKVSTFVMFIVGFCIGIIFTNFLPEMRLVGETVQHNRTTLQNIKKIRILCFANTRPKSHSERVPHVLETWGKHCDKMLFASTSTNVNIGAIGFNLTDDHESMWGKVTQMLTFIHRNFINEYDWFMKADDDSFILAENMRFLLSAYSRDDPIYFGHKFNTTTHKRGYFSGGSGYVMSRKTLRIFVENVLTNPKFYQNDSNADGCHIETDKRTEDYDITTCLDYYNVYAGDARDVLKRDRFLPFWPESHLFGHPDPNFWYWQRKYYFNDEGLDCCSNYTIAYHYISPKLQYTMYYLIYMLKIYGIVRRFPPPPIIKNFADVAYILDEERFNKTLRGY